MAGLIVAIPSLVGYNLLTATIRNLTVTMDNFTEEFMVRIKLEQLALDRNASTTNTPPAPPVPAAAKKSRRSGSLPGLTAIRCSKKCAGYWPTVSR